MLDELKDWISNDYTIYTGTAGVGLLFFRKAPNDTRNLRVCVATFIKPSKTCVLLLQNIRKQYLQLEQLQSKRVTFLCGDCGPLAIGAIVSHKLDDQKIYNFCIRKLTAFIKVVKNSSSDLPNEYLYGRAGFLYALLFVNRHVCPAPFSDAAIKSVRILPCPFLQFTS